MQKLIFAALVVGAGYFAWLEYGSGPRPSTGPTGNGGMGFSSFGKAANTVAGGAVAAARN